MFTEGRQTAESRHRFIRASAWASAGVAALLMTVLTTPLAAQPAVRQVLLNPVPNSYGFGRAMAADGDTLVAGAPTLMQNGIQRGAVSVFTNVAGTWVLQQSLTRNTGLGFGSSVAVSGNTLIAASEYHSPIVDPGPLVFVRQNGTWTQQAELRPSGVTLRTGASVALDGDTALVATYGNGVYVFVRSGAVWTEQAQLRPEAYYSARVHVALQSDTAFIGVGGETVGANQNQGAVYVYTRTGGAWTQQATLLASPGRAGEFFGNHLSASGDTVLVRGDQVYQFVRTGSSWVAQGSLALPTPSILSYYPTFVALHGDTAVVMMHVDPRAPTYAYVYRRVAGRWYRVDPPDQPRNYVIHGDTIFGSDYGNTGEGQVIVFAVPEVSTTGPPGEPENVRAIVSGNTVILRWNPPASGGAPTGYALVGRTVAGGPVLATIPAGMDPPFSVAAPNGRFVLSMIASSADGAGPESAPVTVTVPQLPQPPGPPSGLTATVSGTTVSFNWNPPSSGGPVTGYVLWAGLTPSVSPPLATVPVGVATSYMAAGVPPGTYYVFVQARGNSTASAASNVVMVTVAGAAPPGAPTLNPPIVNGSTVTLSWSPGAGGLSTRYTLSASVSPNAPPLVTVPLTGSSASFANVPAGTYYLMLTAANDGGTSPASPTVVMTVP
jgi:hypothetical protein